MPTNRPGGFGYEQYGDPMGAGGPLHVVRAQAVEGQTVRVVFDEEPNHDSAQGAYDALNPTNYVVVVLTGTGRAPLVVGVKHDMLVGGVPLTYPPAAVEPGTDERGFDVQTDIPLSRDLTYTVTAKNIRSKLGGALGAPYAANFRGLVSRDMLRQRAALENLDLYTDLVSGGFVADDSGDLALQGGLAGYKKRLFRRMMTPQGAFSFMPEYGVGHRLKEPMSVANIGQLKSDLVQQLKQEPETASIQAGVQLDPRGILTIQVKATTKRGAIAELEAKLDTRTGGFVVT